MEKKRFKAKKIDTKEKTGIQKAARGVKDAIGLSGTFVGAYAFAKKYGPQVVKAIKTFKK